VRSLLFVTTVLVFLGSGCAGLGSSTTRKDEKAQCKACSSDYADCLLECFEVCDCYSAVSNCQSHKGCEKCDGKTYTVRDDSPVDGLTVRVCKGVMKR
jgi:hypothetical protein